MDIRFLHSFNPLSSGGFSRDLACPKRFPVFSVLQNFRRYCSAPASDVLGSLLPSFLFCRSVMKKVYWGLLPDILRDCFCGRISYLFCRGGEDKIEVIEEIVSNVLRGVLLPTYLVT